MKKLLPYIAAFLTFFGSLKAQDNFPYDQELNLEYKVTASLIIPGTKIIPGGGKLIYDGKEITGIAKVVSIMGIDYKSDLINDIFLDKGKIVDIPEGHMDILKALFDYMNYIRNAENIEDKSYKLYVPNEKIEVSVKLKEESLENTLKVVEIFSTQGKYILPKYKIKRMEAHFDDEGYLVEAHVNNAKVNPLGFLGLPLIPFISISADGHAYLKQ